MIKVVIAASILAIFAGGVFSFEPIFYATPSFDAGSRPTSLCIADLNGDGDEDIAVANYSGGSVICLLGGPSGLAEQPGGAVAVGTRPSVLRPGDFDGDGRLDVLVLNRTDNTVTFLRGTAAGLASHGVPIECGQGATEIAAGDFNGDGIADAAVLNVTSSDVTCIRGGRDGPEAEVTVANVC